ncbi:MAG: DUF1634 domain-containing protein [Chlorobium sp.]|nr:MAG: DUF1634 domain-containing protein [Chlorobium sp.]
MSDKEKKSESIDKVQLVYARVLEMVSHVGMAFLAIGYLVYVLQLLPLSVPIDAIAGNWHLKASEMQQKLHTPAGWSIISSPAALFKGDVVSYLSIYYLAMATVVCLVFASVTFYREKNYLYTTIAVLQVVVLLVAASGVIH